MKIYFDGGCRPNPGRIEIAVVAAGACHFEPDVGFGSNNDAEWLAAIKALHVGIALGITDIQLLGDSALIVNQANGASRSRTPDLALHLATFETLRSSFSRIRVRRISRSQNLAGIYLAKLRSGR